MPILMTLKKKRVNKPMNRSFRKSLYTSGYILSAGIIFAELLSFFSIIPFNSLIGDQNIAYFGYSYTIYQYVLNILISSIPFAIATQVHKYFDVKDYKTTLMIRRISLGLMLVVGFIGMCVMILMSKPLSNVILANETGESERIMIRYGLILISFALFFVPLLSAYRGFYQGLNETEIYSVSQVIEKIVQVCLMILSSATIIFFFHKDQTMGIFTGIFSISLGAIFALLHVHSFDSKKTKEMKELAQGQTRIENSYGLSILKEIIILALPYAFFAILIYSIELFDLFLFSKLLTSTGLCASFSNYLYGTIYGVHTQKIIILPFMLCFGYMAGVIPLISNAYTEKNMKLMHQRMKECLVNGLYLVLPMALCIGLFSKEIAFAFYGNPTIELRDSLHFVMLHFQQLDYETYILKFRSVEVIFKTLAFMFTFILLACKQYKKSMITVFIGVVIKAVMLILGIQYFGMMNAALSSILAYLVIVMLAILWINQTYSMKWLNTLKKILIICLGLLFSSLGYLVVHLFLRDITRFGRIGQLPLLILELVIVLGIYGIFTAIFKLPQKMLKLKKRSNDEIR